jgi:hypothetical protein
MVSVYFVWRCPTPSPLESLKVRRNKDLGLDLSGRKSGIWRKKIAGKAGKNREKEAKELLSF